MSNCNEDLANERRKCTFNVAELTHFLDGGVEKTRERKERERYFLSDPDLQDKTPPEYLSHKEKYQLAVKKACMIFKKIKDLQEKGGNIDSYRQLLGGSLGSAILKDGNPVTLHYVMFLPTLLGQANIEQQAYWVSRAWDCNILGTYAQTELGHGTFIRGLETTATYDPKTEEFVLSSPTLTSFKWWPGGLGHTANYAIVVAQLYTHGKCYGIHPFIVQLRDEDTHRPMPGIKIGEIGTKLGMNATNNGYLGFENVRIPRTNMLMKNSQVLEDGTYVKAPSSKLTYGTMMFVRVVIVQDMSQYLKKAATIATRYSAVRRQSEMKPGEPEPQILEYQTQQYKLVPNIAASLAMQFSAAWLWDMYNNVSSNIEEGDLEHLPELHAIACCLKAVCSADAAAGVETCRLACGGHGYMQCSNLPATYGLVTAACTYEGENTVMLLQTARYLVKAFQRPAGIGGKASSTVDYSGYSTYRKRTWSNNLKSLMENYKLVAAGLIERAATNMDARLKRGYSPEDAWNMTSIELTQCAEAHCRSFIVEKFAERIEQAELSNELRKVLMQLCELYAVHWLLQRLGNFLMFSNLTAELVPNVQRWMEELLQALRPNVVGLVDGFDMCDEILSSPLGAWDGRVYERLFEEALKSPLNAQDVDESFHKYLKPFMKSNL